MGIANGLFLERSCYMLSPKIDRDATYTFCVTNFCFHHHTPNRTYGYNIYIPSLRIHFSSQSIFCNLNKNQINARSTKLRSQMAVVSNKTFNTDPHDLSSGTIYIFKFHKYDNLCSIHFKNESNQKFSRNLYQCRQLNFLPNKFFAD